MAMNLSFIFFFQVGFLRYLYLITKNDTKISQPKNKTYPHKYKVFSFYEDCQKIGAYKSHHQDESPTKTCSYVQQIVQTFYILIQVFLQI